MRMCGILARLGLVLFGTAAPAWAFPPCRSTDAAPCAVAGGVCSDREAVVEVMTQHHPANAL